MHLPDDIPDDAPPLIIFDDANDSDQETVIVRGGANNCNCLVAMETGRNNSATSQSNHLTYACPQMPEEPSDGHPQFVAYRSEFRMALRPDRFKYVTLTFRFMRRDAQMHVGLVLSQGSIKSTDLYKPIILDRWTRKLQVKLKSMIKVSVLFKSIIARLGLQSTVGLKFCLDGFYGQEAFGDAFGNIGPGVCPWMEVTGEGTPVSLHLEDNDNIFVSVATEKMLEIARLRANHMSEAILKQAQQRGKRSSLIPSQTVGGAKGPSARESNPNLQKVKKSEAEGKGSVLW